VILKVLRHLHEVDVVVERKVGVDHDNPKRVNGDLGFHPQKGLEDVGELGDDPLTVKEVAASSYLNRSIWKNLHRLGTVGVVISESNLIVECCRLQLPLKSTITFGTRALQFERL
jgi:hypothetical protein